MKKILTAMLAFILALTLPLTASAAGNIYTIGEISIEFSGTSAFSSDLQAVIAQSVITGTDDSVTAYNLWCTMFGHSTETETIGVIEHCVSDTAPRCLKTVQDVTACTRCESVIEINTISSYYINCCE